MCTVRGWLAMALCLCFPNKTTLAEDALWQQAIGEGKQLRERGRYVEAERVHLLALGEAEKFGSEDRRLALSLNGLAALYHATGRLREAEPLYRRSLAIWERLSERLEGATLLNNLARLCLDLEKYDEVEQFSKRALTISEGVSPQHPEVARSLNNLADIHAIQGHYAQAEPLYRQALTILEEAFGPEHPEVAYALSHLGNLCFRQARYAEAEALHRRAIAIVQKNPGKRDSVLASSLNLADLAAYQGRNTEAEPLCRQAQTIWERTLGAEHPNVALCLSNRA
jgi:tetratricopeptide (TPR) repeat protein